MEIQGVKFVVTITSAGISKIDVQVDSGRWEINGSIDDNNVGSGVVYKDPDGSLEAKISSAGQSGKVTLVDGNNTTGMTFSNQELSGSFAHTGSDGSVWEGDFTKGTGNGSASGVIKGTNKDGDTASINGSASGDIGFSISDKQKPVDGIPSNSLQGSISVSKGDGYLTTKAQIGDLVSTDKNRSIDDIALDPFLGSGFELQLIGEGPLDTLDPQVLMGAIEGFGLENLLGILSGLASAAILSGIGRFLNNIRSAIDPSVNTFFQAGYQYVDPLAIDLDGDGVETVSNSAGVLFDNDADGIKTGTGWISADDGLLVLDRNGNGTIDNGGELFGVDTTLQSGAKAKSVFEALADLDSNADGVFDAKDDKFSSVMVWQDLNQDGISQSNELKSLSDAGVVSIKLASTASSVASNGNVISSQGSFTSIDKTTGALSQGIIDGVDFSKNTFTREFDTKIDIDSTVAALPDMQGSGAVRDLREASMLSASLKAVVSEYAAATSRTEQSALVGELLTDWAESSSFNGFDKQIKSLSKDTLSIDFAYSWDLPSAQATQPTAAQLALKATLEKAKVLEAFTGTNYFGFGETVAADGSVTFTTSTGKYNGGRRAVTKTPVDGVIHLTEADFGFGSYQIDQINKAYDALVGSVYTGLISQTLLKPYVDLVGLSFNDDGIVIDYSKVQQRLLDNYSQSPIGTLADALQLGSSLGNDFIHEMSGTISQWSYSLTPDQLADLQVQLQGSSKIAAAGSLSGGDANDVILGDSSNRSISGGLGSDVLIGGSGAESINGDDGDDVLNGGGGNDSLGGGNGDDLLDGSTGNDTLDGGAGNDTYLLRVGSGQDVISSYDSTVGHVDTLQFEDVKSTELTGVKRVGYDLVLQYGVSDQVTVSYQFASDAYGISQIVFADGVTFDMAKLYSSYPMQLTDGNDYGSFANVPMTILAGAGNDSLNMGSGDDHVYGDDGNDSLSGNDGNDQLYGGADNDYLSGGNGNDLLDGGTGNDTLDGGAGNNTYLLRIGSGQDVISAYDSTAGRVDTLQFEDVKSTELTGVKRLGSDLVLQYGISDQVTINYQFASDAYGITQIVFADGVTFDLAKLYSSYTLQLTDVNDSGSFANASMTILAGAGNDSLTMGTGDDRVYGDAGNDTLNGNDGNDQLYGGADNDYLSGGNGNDLLDGGTGNDTLDGGAGNNTYLLRIGSGQDVINTYDLTAGRIDTLKFEDVKSTELTGVKRVGSDLVLQYGISDQVTINYQFASDAYGITQIVFADGVTFDLAKLYSSYTLQLTDGNDSGSFANASMTILAGAGNDSLTMGTGDDRVYGDAGNDTLSGNDGNDQLYGGADNDYLSGGNGNDLLDGGTGNDTLDSGVGNDTYLLRIGSGQDVISAYDSTAGRVDTLQFEDVKSTELTGVKRVGSDLVLQYGISDQVTVNYQFASDAYGITQIVFADGVTFDLAKLYSSYTLQLTDGNDSGSFANASMTILAGAGNDSLTMGTGDDRVYGDAGNDTLNGNDGNDQLYGGADNDYLSGGNGNDLLDGGTGNDTLDGGAGNNTYLLRIGSGQDVISAYDSTAGRVDTLQFEDVKSTELTGVKRVGSDLVLQYGISDQVTVNYQCASDAYGITQIVFADGVTFDLAKLYSSYTLQLTDGNDSGSFANASMTILAGAGNDSLTMGTGDDRVYGDAGNDTLNGNDGNDQLYGGADNDYLSGGNGNDLLDGGTGNDTLDGGAGNDTYLLRIGSGQDVISTYDLTAGRIDTLKFEDVKSTELTGVKRVGSDLVLQYGISDQVTVNYQFASDAYGITQIVFADGVTFDLAKLYSSYTLQLTDGNDSGSFANASMTILAGAGNDSLTMGTGDDRVYGDAGNDTLNGNDGNDQLYGGADNDYLSGGNGNDLLDGGTGNDTLDGGNGDDVLDGGTGNDSLDGGNGNDTYVLRRGSGQDVISTYDSTVGHLDTIQFDDVKSTELTGVKRVGYDLVLQYGANDQVTVNRQFNGDNYGINRIVFADGITFDMAKLYSSYTMQLTDGDDYGSFSNAPITVLAGAGNDSLTMGAGDDRVYGEAGNDNVDGGDGNDQLFGGADNDYLSGGNGNDLLDGGTGNDSMSGGAGDDTYLLRIGSGQDVISSYDSTAGRVDTIQFEDVKSTELTGIKRVGYDLVLQYGANDQVTVSQQFVGDNYGINQISFADGITFDMAKLYASYPIQLTDSDNSMSFGAAAVTVHAGAGNDSLTMGAGDDRAYGDAGNDSLDGGDGNDQLYGAADNDYLNGGNGDDLLDGGSGNDTLIGGAGNDTYLLRTGSGQDVVNTYDSTVGRVDTIQFEDVKSTELTSVKRVGYDLVLQYGVSDQVTVSYQFLNDSYGINQIAFADGVTFDMAKLYASYPVQLTDGNDSMSFGNAPITVKAGAGDDYLNLGTGDDRVYGDAGNDSLYGGEGNDQLYGGVGNDSLTGGNGNDLLDGGTGNDSLEGDAGNDTYLFRTGSGQDVINTYDSTAGRVDTIQFEDVKSTELTAVKRVGYDLVLQYGASDQVTVTYQFLGDTYGINQVAFADGVTFDMARLYASYPVQLTDGNDSMSFGNAPTTVRTGAGDDSLSMGAGDDRVYGDAGNDSLSSNDGNDQLYGGAGNDTLYGGNGDDLLEGGTGADYLDGGYGSDVYKLSMGDGADTISSYDPVSSDIDTLLFGDNISANQLWFRSNGSSLDISIVGTTDKVTIQNWDAGSNYHLDQFKTADGKTLLDSQVQNLVNTMASFGVPAGSETSITADQRSQLDTVIAANWK